MTISRELTEGEILPAIIAGLVAAQQPNLDIALAVGTAERIAEEIIQRADNPEYPGTPLDPGVLFIDEWASQRNDGGDKQAGISIAWVRGEEIGPEGNALTPDEVTELMASVIGEVERWAADKGSRFTVLYDRDE